MKTSSLLLVGLLAIGCRQQSPAQAPSSTDLAEPSRATVHAAATVLADAFEPGERMEFWGRVLDYQGRPLPEAAIVAYQTDATGLYNPPEANTRVPRLRAVAVTEENGGFRFSTIRPGPYPGGGNPQHIHLTITAPAHRFRYVTYWFDDDPLVTPERRSHLGDETVIVALSQDENGTWTFSLDIRLLGN